MNVEDFFKKAGLTPRPLQLETARELASQLPGNVGLEAPPGWGKTIAVLAALASAGALPAVWRVRTYPQARRISEDVAVANLKPFVAGGRERTCPLAGELRANVHHYCRYLKHKCPYFKLLVESPVRLGYVPSYEDLPPEVCRYYLQENVGADVYIATYNTGLNFGGVQTVVDEAHNAVSVQSMPLSKLREGLAELAQVAGSEELLDKVEKFDVVTNVRVYLEELTAALVEALEKGARPRSAPKVLSFIREAPFLWREGEEVYTLKVYRPRGPSLYVSATLTPVAHVFNVPVVSVPWQKKYTAAITTWLTTAYREYGPPLAREYNNLLFFLRRFFDRILVFATSRVARTLLVDVTNPEEWNRGTLLLLSHGRYAEGVNLPADCVVMAGAPYLPPYVSARLAAVGLKPDDVVAITTVQNVGRATRTPSASPFIVLADERYARLSIPYFDVVEVHSLKDLEAIITKLVRVHATQ